MTDQPVIPVVEPSPEYLAREKRLDDAMHLRHPDRVPVAPLAIHFYATRARGISNKDAMYNMAQTFQIWKETTIQYNWDAAAPPGPLIPARPLDLLGIKQIKWPGGTIADNLPFQWVDGEYMLQEEYDEMLADANGFAVKKLWPRIATTLAPISGIAQMPAPSILFISHPMLLGNMLSPSMVDLIPKALELAQETAKNTAITMKYVMEMKQLGYPLVWSAITCTAFDWISDTLRGLRGIMLDMYRVPEKLLAAIDMFTPITIQSAVMVAKQTGVKGVFIPLHRGAGGFMSNAQYDKFYWPSLKALLLGLIEADLLPIPFFEGDYNPRLEFLQELPPKKVVGHFDVVDRKRAKKMIGDMMCFWGNVPAQIMAVGTPEQVKDDVKALIDIFGDNGGLIIDSTVGLPDESRPENVQALTDAVFEYGVYR